MAFGGLGGALGGVLGGAGGLASSILSPLSTALGLGGPQTTNQTMQVAPASEEEKRLQKMLMQQASRNAQTVAPSPFAGYNFADPLIQQSQQLAKNYQQAFKDVSLLPTEEDVTFAQRYINQLFAPQEAALKESAKTQTQEASRLAASLGRSVADPVLQAKLRQTLMSQQAGLEAQRTASIAQVAGELPERRLNVLSKQLESQQAGIGILGGLFQTQTALQQYQTQQQNDQNRAREQERSQLYQQLQNLRLSSAGRITTAPGENPLAALIGLGSSAASAYATYGISSALSGRASGGGTTSPYMLESGSR